MTKFKYKYIVIVVLLIAAGGLFYAFGKNNPEISILPEDAAGNPPPTGGSTPQNPNITLTPTPSNIDVPATNTITAADIISCMGKGSESGNCYDLLFRGFLKNHTTVQALALVTKLGEKDSSLLLSCHPIIHAIGRETFLQKKTVQNSFSACDQTCHSGCYHGAMERFLRGDSATTNTDHVSAEEVKEKARTACDPSQPVRFRFQCLHGLGHALMYFLDYDLEGSLASCDVYPDGWSRSSCYGGAFMENVFTATPEKRDLSPTDYHYPCSKLGAQYKADCYMMQTTRMSEMGLNTDQLFEECKEAGSYRHLCMQSVGRDLSNDARIGSARAVAEKCERVTEGDRQACLRGVVYALEDNTWTGQYSFPFCASFATEADQRYCFQIGIAYLKSTFETTPAKIQTQCSQYVPSSNICRE